MSLYFHDKKYKKRALEGTKKEYVDNHSVFDAFFTLIEGVDMEDLTNLCKIINNFFGYKDPMTFTECYMLTQGKSISKYQMNESVKRDIFLLAYSECLMNNLPLGTKTINDGKINTSDWMGHCLWEGELAAELAFYMGLDPHRAMKMGILHDYGRKKSHDSSHITYGYELLCDKGWENEAIACLTHSFLKGGRCSWNDQPEDGFYVDDDGNPHWLPDCEKDDITVFLEKYKYTDYDVILNIADLMATSGGIVSPAERIADIATRRKAFDPRNRLYFLAELTNALMWALERIGGTVPEDMKEPVKAKKGVTLEEITKKFKRASEVFFARYEEMKCPMFVKFFDER